MRRRNVKHSVDHFHANAFAARAFRPALGRECGMALSPALRPKPHPDVLLHVCRQWDVGPHEAAFVGDSPKDDVSCGPLPSALSDPSGSAFCRSLTQ